MTKLTFTKDDPPPPDSLPDAPRAGAAAAADAWTADDAAFMAGWEDDASDGGEAETEAGEPCAFCGGPGHGVDECPMRGDASGDVGEERPDPLARLVDAVADAVLDSADESLATFLADLAARGLRVRRYNDLVSAIVRSGDLDDELAERFDVDAGGLGELRTAVNREVDKLKAAHALHHDDLLSGLSPEQVKGFEGAPAWDDDDARTMPAEPRLPPPPPPRRTVDIPALGIRVSADPTDEDGDDDDRDHIFSRGSNGRVDWRAAGQPVDGASSVRLAPVREEGDSDGEDDLPEGYLERLSKDLGQMFVQEGKSLDSF